MALIMVIFCPRFLAYHVPPLSPDKARPNSLVINYDVYLGLIQKYHLADQVPTLFVGYSVS
jgi:hypothetical protein